MKKDDLSASFVTIERMQKTSKYYWWLQFGGWGILALILILINLLFGQRVDEHFLIGLGINYIGISPIQALIFTAILYGITSPVLIAVILHISNNKKVMGEFTNGKWSNILGITTLLLMTAAAIILIYFQFK